MITNISTACDYRSGGSGAGAPPAPPRPAPPPLPVIADGGTTLFTYWNGVRARSSVLCTSY